MQAVPQLDDTVPTLVLYGDVPLTTEASRGGYTATICIPEVQPKRTTDLRLRG